MSDKLHEDLSALMDGELTDRSASRTVDALLDSDELKVRWTRYHAVRDVLRQEMYRDDGGALAGRVRELLIDEPHHLSPRKTAMPRWQTALKPVAGMALAASVAVVAVLAVRSGGPGPETPAVVTAPAERMAASTAMPVRGAAIPAAATTSGQDLRPIPLRQLHWSTDEPAIAHRLNGYLVNHSEHLGGPMGGLHPYVRIVGYDTADQR